jgi:hypothetical protein
LYEIIEGNECTVGICSTGIRRLEAWNVWKSTGQDERIQIIAVLKIQIGCDTLVERWRSYRKTTNNGIV